MKKISGETLNIIRELRSQGATLKEIAEKINESRNVVIYLVRIYKIPLGKRLSMHKKIAIEHREFDEKQTKDLLADAKRMSLNQLCKRYHFGKDTIKKILNKHNITPKKEYGVFTDYKGRKETRNTSGIPNIRDFTIDQYDVRPKSKIKILRHTY